MCGTTTPAHQHTSSSTPTTHTLVVNEHNTYQPPAALCAASTASRMSLRLPSAASVPSEKVRENEIVWSIRAQRTADQRAIWCVDWARIVTVRTFLFAANVHFVRAIHTNASALSSITHRRRHHRCRLHCHSLTLYTGFCCLAPTAAGRAGVESGHVGFSVGNVNDGRARGCHAGFTYSY